MKSTNIRIRALDCQYVSESEASHNSGIWLATSCICKTCGGLGFADLGKRSLVSHTVNTMSVNVRLFLWVGLFLLMSSFGVLIAFLVMGTLEGGSADWHFCSWYSAALGSLWPILSSLQLFLHSKMYRDEFRDLRALLDY